MKQLSITSSIGQRLAEIALFERIQFAFNIYPTQIVSAFRYALLRDKSMRKGTIPLILETTKVQFEKTFDEIKLILEGKEVVETGQSTEQRMIGEYFNLNPILLARDIKKKAELEGCDPIEATTYLKSATKDVLDWAFAEAIRTVTD